MMKTNICGLSSDEILNLIAPSGFTIKHALLLSNSIYKKRIFDFGRVPGIPKILKNYLENNSAIGVIPPVAFQVSEDKSVKYLFRTDDGREFETVYIPDGKRNTVCVSSQSGCKMGCSFCATAGYGFSGDLTAGEIVNQVISIPDAEKVTHVVFMGMGEPFDNIDNILKACKILTSEWGLSLSSRNITVSTVGVTPGIMKFLESSFCNLTVSLHSPFSEERMLLIPAEKKYPVNEIIRILKNHKLKRNRRITLAYVMIQNLNDTDSHLEALKDLLTGSVIRVNIIPFHRVPNNENVSSSAERMQYFKHSLVVSGVSASVRKSRGADISAACGLLATGLKKQ